MLQGRFRRTHLGEFAEAAGKCEVGLDLQRQGFILSASHLMLWRLLIFVIAAFSGGSLRDAGTSFCDLKRAE